MPVADRPAFKTLFAVPIECNDCIKSVEDSIYKVDGISNVVCNLKNQLVEVEGTAAPSAIAEAIRETGKDAILRGSGLPNSAAVCILETHAPHVQDPVRGLVRMVQVGPKFTIIDLSVKGLPAGIYHVSIRQSGDISNGAASTGAVWETLDNDSQHSRGRLGDVDIEATGRANILLDSSIDIWELIGRSIVVSREIESFAKNDETTLVGVIARSAGAWENDKTVCSCSGKTVWEERAEQAAKGMF